MSLNTTIHEVFPNEVTTLVSKKPSHKSKYLELFITNTVDDSEPVNFITKPSDINNNNNSDENNNKNTSFNKDNSSGTAFVYFPNFINKDKSILHPKENFVSNIIGRIKRLNYMNAYKKLGPIPRQHLITMDTESIYKHQIPWRTRVLERVRFKTSQVAEEDDGDEYDDGYHFQDPDHANGRFYTYKRMIYSKGEPYFLKRVTNCCGNFANQKSILPISNNEEILNTFLADSFASIKNWTVAFEVSAWTSNTTSFFYDYGIDSTKILKMSDEDFDLEKKTNLNFVENVDTVVISNKPRLEKLLTNEKLEKSLDKIGEGTLFVKNYVTKTRSKVKSVVQPKTDEVVNIIKNLLKKPFKK